MNERSAITSTIVSIAAEQGGVVSRRQLLEAGLSSGVVGRRRKSSWLLPVCPGVYAVGRPISGDEGIWTAGVLAGGSGTFLARHCAAALWGLIQWNGAVEIVRAESRNPSRTLLGRPGLATVRPLEVRRSRHLDPPHTTTCRGIPVTSVARTLLDLAGSESERKLRSMFNEADRRGLLSEVEMIECLEVRGGIKGGGTLSKMVESRHPSVGATRSELEVMFLDLVRGSHLPEPVINSVICGLEVDCLWRRQGLVVELDGFEFHRGRVAFERDLARDKKLRLAGLRVIRLSYGMVRDEARDVVELVRRELAGGQ